jgi:hypothetical protein
MFKQLIAVTVVSLCVGVGVTAAQTTQFPQQLGDTFTWHGELVSFDQGTKALTVRAHVLAETEKEVGRFKAGDHLLVTWSGADRYAGSVRSLASYTAGQTIAQPFSLVAELTSPVVQNGLVTFRLQVPDAETEALNSITPGEWVTMTARQRPASTTQAIVSVEPYVKELEGTH